MQTFLPYPDFQLSVRCLDSKRLGKQRVEAFQILKTLKGESEAWKNHPAVLMWKGYEKALTLYLRECILEWLRRQYKNSMILPEHAELTKEDYPPWYGSHDFHISHQSNLIRKNEVFYKKLFETINREYELFKNDIELNGELKYVWPVRKTN